MRDETRVMSTDAGKRVRAVGFRAYGGPEVLEVVSLEPEPLGADDVRIQVAASTVNPTDVVRRAGQRATGGRPETVDVPGMEVAGLVTEVGARVTSVGVGDRVMAIVAPAGEHGGHRADVVVPAVSVVRSPSNLSDVEAATIPMNGLTALHALDAMNLSAGDVVAVTGAAGAVGGYVVQLAKHAGLRVVADAAENDRELVASLGADVILPRGPGFAAAVRERFPHGVDGLADAAIQNAEVLDAVRDGGTVTTFRRYTGDGTSRIRVVPISVLEVAERTDLLERLREHAEAGVITARVNEVFPPEEVAKAHRLLEAGGLRGRLVLGWS
ncbi:NADP-dependent oxidoreductase [Thermocrispum sp.]|uniref:NADP-dependent oxidoreductase n=2 Tax=Thermocrispum agreste TaxID=37925 RepID=A0ABD6FC17_9PSEU|nr:NADP-dependent oxidoreductase [Thermocrispum sp.]